MAHDRAFRFGVQLTTAADRPAWTALCRRVEALGYSSLLLPDHFSDQLAPLPAAIAAANATSTLRVGTLVCANDYRHPVVLAKEAATIDVLSSGRLELGLGAGWMNADYQQSGIVKDRHGARIDRLVEALSIVRGLWSSGPYSFEGKHYRVADLDGLPKPAQQPGPPLLIGAGGPKMLAVAARHADIVGINPSLPKGHRDVSDAAQLRPPRLDEKVAVLREAAGERFDDLELSVLVFAAVVGANGTGHHLAERFAMRPEDLDATPYAWAGPAGKVADQLRAARDRWGLSYFVLQGRDAMEAAAPVVAELAGT